MSKRHGTCNHKSAHNHEQKEAVHPSEHFEDKPLKYSPLSTSARGNRLALKKAGQVHYRQTEKRPLK